MNMIKTKDFAEKALYEQFSLKDNLSNYDIVYIGNDYDVASNTCIDKFNERYGDKENFMHIGPENMEMAIEQEGQIKFYIGENFTDQEGEYIALVMKKEGE